MTPLTAEDFVEMASAEKALKQQMKATGQTVEADTLKGCLLATVQLAQLLHLKEEDLLMLLKERWGLWEQYEATKLKIAAKRKEQR